MKWRSPGSEFYSSGHFPISCRLQRKYKRHWTKEKLKFNQVKVFSSMFVCLSVPFTSIYNTNFYIWNSIIICNHWIRIIKVNSKWQFILFFCYSSYYYSRGCEHISTTMFICRVREINVRTEISVQSVCLQAHNFCFQSEHCINILKTN